MYLLKDSSDPVSLKREAGKTAAMPHQNLITAARKAVNDALFADANSQLKKTAYEAATLNADCVASRESYDALNVGEYVA